MTLKSIINELKEIGFSGKNRRYSIEFDLEGYHYSVDIQLKIINENQLQWIYMRFWHKIKDDIKKKKEYKSGFMLSDTNTYKNYYSCLEYGIEGLNHHPKLDGYIQGVVDAINTPKLIKLSLFEVKP